MNKHNAHSAAYTHLRKIHACLVVLAVAALWPCLGRAATVTWDASGTSAAAPTDGAGTWSTTGTNWSNGSTDAAWSSGNNAVFGNNNGAAGTVTVGAVTVGNITFNSPGSGSYTLTSGTITLGGGTITVNNGSDTISSTISDSSFLTASGTGTLFLNGPNDSIAGMNVNAGTVAQTTGSSTYTNGINVGTANGATGTISLSGGTFTQTSANNGQIFLGQTSGATGIMNISGSAVVNVNYSLQVGAAAGSTGTCTISGGTLNLGDNLLIANQGSGTFTQTGGSVTDTGASAASIGGASGVVGTLSISGGTFTDSSQFNLAGGAGATANLLVSGGTFNQTASTFYMGVGSNSVANLTVSGSGVFSLQALNMEYAAANDTLNLNGGTLSTASVGQTTTTGTATINFNGGTFQAGGTISIPTTVVTAVQAGGAVLNPNGNNITINGALVTGSSAGGGLTVSGAGKLILLGSNSYTGATTISQGTLQLGNSGTTGALATASAITDNGTLSFSHTNAVTQGTDFSGAAITGSGGITQAGTGLLTLNAANTYSGATTLTSGTVNLSNQNAVQNSAVTMSGGTLVFDQSVTSGSFTFGGLAAASSGAGYNIALQNNAGTPAPVALTVGGNGATTTYAGVLSGSGSLIVTGPGALTVSGENTYTGGTIVNGGTLNLADESQPGGGSGDIRGTLTINNGGTVNANNDWTFGYNASAGNDVSSVIINSGTLNWVGAAGLGGGGSPTTITMTGAAISGSGWTWYDALTNTPSIVTNSSSSTSVISSPVSLRSFTNVTFNVAPGTTASGVDLLVSGVLSTQTTNPTIIKSGSGVLEFTGIDTYAGSTTVNAGTLIIGGAGQLNSGNYGGSIANNGTLIFASSTNQTLTGAVTGSGLTQIGNGVTPTTVNDTASSAFTAISGTLAVANGSTLNISGNNNVLPRTTGAPGGNNGSLVVNGTLDITDSSEHTLDSTGVVALNNGTLTTTTGNSGGGSFFITGSRSFLLTGSDTISGPNVVYLGTGVTLTLNTVNSTDTLLLSGQINANSAGGIAKSGSGTVTITGTEAYTGSTTVSAGTLTIGGAGQLGGGNYGGSIVNNGTLIFASSTNQTLTAAVTGSGLTQFGNGTTSTTVNDTGGFETISGTMAIANGSTLKLSGGNNMLPRGTPNGNNGSMVINGTLDITDGSIESLDGTGSISMNNGTLTTPVGNSTDGSFLIGGAGQTFTLTGSNTISGPDVIGVNNSVALTLNTVHAADTLLVSGQIINTSGNSTGGIAKSGSGTVTLTGTNTYTGPTTVNAGTLTIGGAGVLGGGNYGGSIVNNGTLIFASSTNQTLTAAVTGSGLTQFGNGVTPTTVTDSGGFVAISGTMAIANGSTLNMSGGNNLLPRGTAAGGNNGSLVVDGTLSIGSGIAETIDSAGVIALNNGTLTTPSGNTTFGAFFISGNQTLNLTGSNTISGSDVIGMGNAATLTLNTVNAADTLLVSGQIINTSGGGIAKSGAGTVTLTGSNTYTGSTTINAGTLQIGNGGTTGSIGSTSGISGSAGATLAFDLSTSGTFNRPISSGLNVTQAGSGTLTLAGSALGYSGTTTVTNGTLIVAGSISGNAVVLGGTFGTTGGTGDTITGGKNLTVGNGLGAAASSVLDPSVGGGASTTVLNVTGNVSLNSDAAFVFALNSGALGHSDGLAVSGTLTLAGALLQGQDIGNTPLAPGVDQIAIASFGTLNGTFAGLPEGGLINIGQNWFSIDYGNINPGEITLTSAAIPEPGTWATVLAGLGLLCAYQRRRRLNIK